MSPRPSRKQQSSGRTGPVTPRAGQYFLQEEATKIYAIPERRRPEAKMKGKRDLSQKNYNRTHFDFRHEFVIL